MASPADSPREWGSRRPFLLLFRSSVWTLATGRVGQGEQLPLAGRPLQLVGALVHEVDAGPHHQVLDGARDHDLAAVRLGCDPRADVDGDAADVGAHQLDLTGVQAGPDL